MLSFGTILVIVMVVAHFVYLKGLGGSLLNDKTYN